MPPEDAEPGTYTIWEANLSEGRANEQAEMGDRVLVSTYADVRRATRISNRGRAYDTKHATHAAPHSETGGLFIGPTVMSIQPQSGEERNAMAVFEGVEG